MGILLLGAQALLGLTPVVGHSGQWTQGHHLISTACSAVDLSLSLLVILAKLISGCLIYSLVLSGSPAAGYGRGRQSQILRRGFNIQVLYDSEPPQYNLGYARALLSVQPIIETTATV